MAEECIWWACSDMLSLLIQLPRSIKWWFYFTGLQWVMNVVNLLLVTQGTHKRGWCPGLNCCQFQTQVKKSNQCKDKIKSTVRILIVDKISFHSLWMYVLATWWLVINGDMEQGCLLKFQILWTDLNLPKTYIL